MHIIKNIFQNISKKIRIKWPNDLLNKKKYAEFSRSINYNKKIS